MPDEGPDSTQCVRSPPSIRSTGHAPKAVIAGRLWQLREAHSLGPAHVTAGSRRNGTRFRSAPHRTACSSARGLRARTHPAERRTYLLSCFVASSAVPGGFDRRRRTPIAIRRCPRHANGPSWPRDDPTSPQSGYRPQKEIIAMQTAKFDTGDTDPLRRRCRRYRLSHNCMFGRGEHRRRRQGQECRDLGCR